MFEKFDESYFRLLSTTHRRLTEICRTFPKGRYDLEVTITDSQRLRTTPYIDLKYF